MFTSGRPVGDQLRSELSFSNCLKGTGIEYGRSASHAGADAGLEIIADPGLHLGGAPVGLEAFQIETQILDPLPKMRVVDPPPVRVERVDHLEEAPLATGGLGGGVESRRARMLAGDREVTENEPPRLGVQLLPVGGASRAAEVGVDDDPLLSLAADVVV